MDSKQKQILIDTLQSLKLAYMLKTGIGLFQAMIQLVTKYRLPVSFIRLLINQNTLKFCCFLGSLTFLKKTILYILRRQFKKDSKYMAFFSGFIAGFFSLMIMDKESRSVWALYMLVRTLDTVFTSLKQRGIIKQRNFYYVLLLFIEQFVCGYAYYYETDALSDSFAPLFRRFYQFTPRELHEIETYNYAKGLQMK